MHLQAACVRRSTEAGEHSVPCAPQGLAGAAARLAERATSSGVLLSSKWAGSLAVGRVAKPTNAARQVDVPHHDGDSLRVDGAQVPVRASKRRAVGGLFPHCTPSDTLTQATQQAALGAVQHNTNCRLVRSMPRCLPYTHAGHARRTFCPSAGTHTSSNRCTK